MTDPYDAPRPSEEQHTSAVTSTWWPAFDQLRSRRVGPAFDTDAEAIRHAQEYVRSGEDAVVFRRDVRPNGNYTDVRVWPPEQAGVQRDHLTVMTRHLSELLTGTKRRRDKVSTGARGSGHVERPAETMDPATRALPYDAIYNEDGTPKIAWDDTGWPIERKADQ